MPTVIKLGRNTKEAAGIINVSAVDFDAKDGPSKKKRKIVDEDEEEKPRKKQQESFQAPLGTAVWDPDAAKAVEDLPDPVMLRRKKLVQIRLYKKNFPKKLEEVNIDNIAELEVDELDKIIKDMQSILSGAGNEDVIRGFSEIALKAVETVGVAAGFRVQTLADSLKKDEEWNDLMKELELENFDYIHMPLDRRILWKLVRTGYTLHSANDYMEGTPQLNHDKVPQYLVAKYAGL